MCAKSRQEARKHRPKRAKRQKAMAIERLVKPHLSKPNKDNPDKPRVPVPGGLTVKIAPGKEYGRDEKDRPLTFKAEVRVFVPFEALPQELQEQADASGFVRNAEFETEYWETQNVFSLCIVSNKTTRRALRRFCRENNVRMLDHPKKEQPWLKSPYGQCRAIGFWGEPIADPEKAESPEGDFYKESKPRSAYCVAFSFYSITPELMERLRVQTWTRETYITRTPQAANSSADHRLGEKLKHRKKSMADRVDERKAFNALRDQFRAKNGFASQKPYKALNVGKYQGERFPLERNLLEKRFVRKGDK